VARGVVLRSVMARVVVLQNVVRSAVVLQNVMGPAVVALSFSTTNRCSSNCSTTKCRKISRCGSSCDGTKLGPSISPLQEVANRAHVSKRDQFWDQFRGRLWVSFRVGKSSSRQGFRVRLYEKTHTRRLSVQKFILVSARISIVQPSPFWSLLYIQACTAKPVSDHVSGTGNSL
jgi:hypothetical protein